MSLQSILISKNSYTKNQANKWIREHGFIENFKGKKGAHETDNYFRYRQKLPNKQKKYRTSRIDKGIYFILEY